MNTIARFSKEKLKKVVIIGASHSGFSAAWMLLNGPADLWHNTTVDLSC
jgi:predicted NAD/FAD-binding protein